MAAVKRLLIHRSNGGVNFIFSDLLEVLGLTLICKQGIAQPIARRREGCRIFRYVSETDSINPSLLFQTLDNVFPKHPFEITKRYQQL